MTVVHGALHFRDPDQDAQFQGFVKTLGVEPRSMAVKFEGEESYCVFRGRRLDQGSKFCIDIRFTSPRFAPTLLDFDRVFGLTSSEAKTAIALYGGQSAQQIAAMHQIAIHTVRSHIRQLYSKIGISRREQLFRQLDAFRVD